MLETVAYPVRGAILGSRLASLPFSTSLGMIMAAARVKPPSSFHDVVVMMGHILYFYSFYSFVKSFAFSCLVHVWPCFQFPLSIQCSRPLLCCKLQSNPTICSALSRIGWTVHVCLWPRTLSREVCGI